MTNDQAGADRFPEPPVESLDLVTVLKALADPVRLVIVRRLSDDEAHSCSASEYEVPVSKSTLSHHFRTLREAGVTRTHVNGREHAVELRRGDLDARWPGLLDHVLQGARRDGIVRY
jgi:DNA-binding transcriptional ArsR family regulator